MNWDTDDLLDTVDEWKAKVYEQIKELSQEERLAFFRQAGDQALAAGLVRAQPLPKKKAVKRRPKRAS